MNIKTFFKYHLSIIFYFVSGFLVLSATSLNFAALLFLAIFPVYLGASLLTTDPLRSYKLGTHFFLVGLIAEGLILLFMDYSSFAFPNPERFFLNVFAGEIC